jgi:hypothetical protein
MPACMNIAVSAQSAACRHAKKPKVHGVLSGCKPIRGFESAGSRTLVRSPSTSGAPNPFWGARVPHLGECARENELEATWMIQSPSS